MRHPEYEYYDVRPSFAAKAAGASWAVLRYVIYAALMFVRIPLQLLSNLV